jgi:hypothetical protein
MVESRTWRSVFVVVVVVGVKGEWRRLRRGLVLVLGWFCCWK